MRASRDNTGFTVVELLIVIIIIGILAVIALPVYLTQRDRAKDSGVKSGVYDIPLCLASYAVDHRDASPAAVPDKTALVEGGGDSHVDYWPLNPWSRADTRSGAARGDYTYAQSGGGTSFTLAGHLSTDDFVVP